jgi:hypothetical protein
MASYRELPSGRYQFLVWHRRRQWAATVRCDEATACRISQRLDELLKSLRWGDISIPEGEHPGLVLVAKARADVLEARPWTGRMV